MKHTFLKLLRAIPKGFVEGCLRFLHIVNKKIAWFSLRLNINTLQRKEVKTWDAVHGDETLRLNYPLNESSIVFDVGGFSGEWAIPIFLKYMPTIHIFEPVKESAKILRKKFSNNKKIYTHEIGLSGKTELARISLESHSASTHNTNHSKKFDEIKLVAISEFMKRHNIYHIDLVKINIEGGEYDLLEHILDTGIVNHIDNIQVQFHDFIPHAEARMNSIKKRLLKTHSLTYEYEFVWENWKRNI